MYPKILITKNNDNLSLILGGKHYLFQGDRVEGIFNAAMSYKEASSLNLTSVEERYNNLVELLEPIKRKDIAQYFTTDGRNVYLGQTNIPVPDSLYKTIMAFIEKGYNIDAFANFWRFCLMNPNTDARDRFFDYCQQYGVTITDKGYAVLYKAVNKDKSAKDTTGLAEFVSTQWLKVKRWKKSPANYTVFENMVNLDNIDKPKYEITNTGGMPIGAKRLGTLQELHENINELASNDGLVFKPWHRGPYGDIIELGKAVTMPREVCDSNIANECSYGLHIGSYQYVSAFGSGLDSILAVLVNPMDIVALPQYDNSKIRTCRYMPYAMIERDENGIWTEIESELFDDDFIAQEDEDILDAVYQDPKLLTQTTIDDIVKYIPSTLHVEYTYEDDDENELDEEDYWDDDDSWEE